MTDQIVDLMEAVMPGPQGARGPQGQQGLAGVNAVPADEAVADWIGKDSATADALHAKYGVPMKELSDRINALEQNKQDKDRRNVMVVFGDSIGAGYGLDNPTTERWTAQLAAQTGLTEKNYAVSGSHINQINDQLKRSIKDASYTAANVKMVVISSGVNNYATEDTETDTRYMLAAIETAYPDALLVFTPCLMGYVWSNYNEPAAGRLPILSRIIRGAQGSKAVIFGDAITWLLGVRDGSQSDGLHPSPAGCKLIAQNVWSGLHGGGNVSSLYSTDDDITNVGVTTDELSHICDVNMNENFQLDKLRLHYKKTGPTRARLYISADVTVLNKPGIVGARQSTIISFDFKPWIKASLWAFELQAIGFYLIDQGNPQASNDQLNSHALIRITEGRATAFVRRDSDKLFAAGQKYAVIINLPDIDLLGTVGRM